MADNQLPQESLDSIVATQKIEVLNLAPSVVNILLEDNLVTIGDIYDLQSDGLEVLLGIDAKLADQIWFRTIEYVSNPNNIYQTLSLFHKDTLPSFLETDILINLPSILPDFTQEVFDTINKPKRFNILQHRYGLNGKEFYTLEQLGAYYEITRERIRQLEKEAKHIFIQALMLGSTLSTNTEIDRKLINEVNELRYVLSKEAPLEAI